MHYGELQLWSLNQRHAALGAAAGRRAALECDIRKTSPNSNAQYGPLLPMANFLKEFGAIDY